MAQHTHMNRKADLAGELDRARAGIGRGWAGISRCANIPAHFKQSIRRNKSAWLAAAVLGGWVLSRLPARRKKVYVDRDDRTIKTAKKTGVFLGLARLALPLIKPAVMAFVTEKVAEAAARKSKFGQKRKKSP
jgi:hypothetical protein